MIDMSHFAIMHSLGGNPQFMNSLHTMRRLQPNHPIFATPPPNFFGGMRPGGGGMMNAMGRIGGGGQMALPHLGPWGGGNYSGLGMGPQPGGMAPGLPGIGMGLDPEFLRRLMAARMSQQAMPFNPNTQQAVPFNPNLFGRVPMGQF